MPELTFLTPNGVFQTGIKSNIFVKNHTDIYAYARDVISFMIDPDEARIKCESEEEQDLLARLESIILKPFQLSTLKISSHLFLNANLQHLPTENEEPVNAQHDSVDSIDKGGNADSTKEDAIDERDCLMDTESVDHKIAIIENIGSLIAEADRRINICAGEIDMIEIDVCALSKQIALGKYIWMVNKMEDISVVRGKLIIMLNGIYISIENIRSISGQLETFEKIARTISDKILASLSKNLSTKFEFFEST